MALFLPKKEDDFDLVTCITGQHSELLYAILNQFRIEYDYDLKTRLRTKPYALSSKIL